MKRKKPINFTRLAIQAFWFVLFVIVGRIVWGIGGSHNLCPWAIIEVPLLVARFGSELFYEIGMAIGSIGILAVILFPRPFCGWICPLGTLFDSIAFIGNKLHIQAKPLPHWLNERMRIFSYGIAVLLMVITFARGYLQCTIACPAFWICSAGEIPIGLVSIVLLVGILILSLRISRGFCRFICPYGALTAMLVPLSRRRIHRNIELCNSCESCRTACPMGIDVMREIDVDSAHCISCNECVVACPKSGFSWKNRKE